jgi:flagellar biosynthesis protein FlhB
MSKFPPSPRRLALARQAGLTAASPVLVGAVACCAALAAAIAFARAASAQIGGWIAAACSGRAGALLPADTARAVVELATPVVGSAALAAVIAHVVQTRTLWLPRRRVPGAPVPAGGPGPRSARTAGELAMTAALGGATLAWLWWAAPRLAALLSGAPLAAVAALIASFVAMLTAAWLVVAAIDALARHAALAHTLAMTPAEKRADDRLAAADLRWRARRAELARGPAPQAVVASAALLLLGDDRAVAIAWDPARQPVPSRAAAGRGARATQLLGLARRYRIPVHRDPELAAALAEAEGPVPEAAWPRLAEIVAAVTRGR